jgi:hypothetical protein
MLIIRVSVLLAASKAIGAMVIKGRITEILGARDRSKLETSNKLELMKSLI